MNISNLVPAYQLAQQFGVKCIAYGPPGSGKTPLLDSLSLLNPVVCVTEPGFLSMRSSSIACYPAFTPEAIDDFLKWALGSHERKQFGVVCIDSISQMAEFDLAKAKTKSKDGRQHYGMMLEATMKRLNDLYWYQDHLHVVLTAKEEPGDGSKDGTPSGRTRPFFPGKAMPVAATHLYDWVFRLGHYNINGTRTRAIQSIESHEYFARERTGRLAEYEQPNLANLIAKLTA